jgi:hypothetical protein
MERECDATVPVNVVVEAIEIARSVHCARQTVYAGVVVRVASTVPVVIGATRRVSQRSKVIVERMPSLHYHDDVVDFADVAVSERRLQPAHAKQNPQNQSPWKYEPPHARFPIRIERVADT